jgi:hypothetical protein
MKVKEVYYYTEGGRDGKQHLRVRIRVEASSGVGVSGVQVGLVLYRNGVLYNSITQTTSADGTVTFRFNGAPAGCYTETLTLTHPTLTWDGVTPLASPSDPFCK